jgi:hypothetical protein
MPRETKWMKNAATGISQFRSISLVVQQEGIEVEWNVFNVYPVVVIGDWSGLSCARSWHRRRHLFVMRFFFFIFGKVFSKT